MTTLQSPTDGYLDAYLLDGRVRRWVPVRSQVIEPLEALEHKTGGGPVIVARSDDNDSWLYYTEDAGPPPTYFWRKASRKQERPIVPRKTSDQVPAPETAQVTSTDGTSIEIWASPPDPLVCDSRSRPCPFIVRLHGGPHQRDGHQYEPEVRWAQQLGFWVLRVNFRGSSGFGEQLANASNREWGGKAIDDIRTAVDWLKHKPGVDPAHGIALGTSYGGFAAIALSTADPNAVGCVESLNGGGDLLAFATLVPERKRSMAEDLTIEVGNPKVAADRALIERMSPVTRLAPSRVKYLVEYGALDQVTPPEQSEGFIASLGRVNQDYLSIRFPEEGHTLSSPEAIGNHYDVLAAFLQACSRSRGQIRLAEYARRYRLWSTVMGGHKGSGLQFGSLRAGAKARDLGRNRPRRSRSVSAVHLQLAIRYLTAPNRLPPAIAPASAPDWRGIPS